MKPRFTFILFLLTCWTLFLLQSHLPAQEQQPAGEDSLPKFEEKKPDELMNIILNTVKKGTIRSFDKKIFDGISYYHAFVETEQDSVFIWIDAYSGNIKKKIYRHKQVPPDSLNNNGAKNEIDLSEGKFIVTRQIAEIIAASQIDGAFKIIRVSDEKYAENEYFEVTVSEDYIGANEKVYWVNKKTAEISYPITSNLQQLYKDHQQNLGKRLNKEIHLSAEDAEKKALELVPGIVVSTRIKKKHNDAFYIVQILKKDKTVKAVEVHAEKGTTRIVSGH